MLKMTSLTDVGEEGLRKMLEVCTDFTERRQIRAALRELQFGSIPGLLADHSNNSNNYISNKMANATHSESGYHGNGLGGETELDRKLREMTDEDAMSNLLHTTEDFQDRRKIRAAIRELRKKKIADQELANAAARKSRMAAPRKPELHLEGIEDEAVLRKMLDGTDDYEQKKQIRAAIRDLRQKAREAAEEVINKEEEAYQRMKHDKDEEHIPAVSVESVEVPKVADQSGVVDFTTIDDIAVLERMLATTEDFGERSQIRAHIKELREKEELGVPDYPGARRLSEGLDADIWLSEKDRRRSSLIDRAALEELTLTKDQVENVSYDEIEDPEELERMLENAVDIGEKRLIRGALKELRKKLEGGGKTGDSAKTKATDETFSKPEIKTTLSEEPSKKDIEIKVKTTSKLNDEFSKSESVSDKAETASKLGKFETPKTVDSNKTVEMFLKVDVPEKKTESFVSRKGNSEEENKENKSAPTRSTTTWEAGKVKKDEIIPSKSSTTSAPSQKEKNNNDISIKPASKLSTSVTTDPGKSKLDTSKFSTPSKFDTTQKENEKNKKESALSSRMSKFTTPTSDSAKAKAEDRPSSLKFDKNGREAKDASLLSSRLSKFSTPTTETTRSTTPGSAIPSGSKLDSLKSRFSRNEPARHSMPIMKDRALRGTEGKVSQAASKFGGSCSGSSCGTTPSQSPSGSTPSSPKRSFGRAAFESPVTQKPFEFGKIHNPSIALSTPKTKSSSSPVPSQNVPSSKLASSKMETSTVAAFSKASTPFGSKDLKVEVPLGKAVSLELQTSGNKTIKVEPSPKSHSSLESKSGDCHGLKSAAEKTDQPRKKSPTERKEGGGKKAESVKMPPVDDIEDEEALEKMLEAASEFEERKKIRARLRELRKKKREELDQKITAQQKAIQDDIQQKREETKANRLKAFEKTTPIKKDTTTTVSKVPLNNNTTKFISGNAPSAKTSSTTVEDTDGKSKTMTTTSVIEGPGSKTVTTTTLSKSEDKDTKSASMKQESMSVKKEETGTSSSVSAKSSSMSSSVTTTSSTGTPAPRKLSKFEAEMEEKKKMRELKRAEEEKNWKEYMAKKKQDDMERKKREMEAAKKKKEALMNKFGGKADAESGGFGRGTGMAAVPNANTIKQKLLEWCQRCARGYPEVKIDNFSSSWADGMAFCAIVHYHFPNAFDFDSLDKKNRRKNFDLAFDSAEKLGDVMPLLETDDMIMMKNKPDWKCVFTYVQSLYRHLNKLKT